MLTADTAPDPQIPADCHRIDPFPRVQSKRSFVSDNPDGDRLRIAYYRKGDEPVLRAKVWFGPATEGPPGYAHGGSMAAVLDEAIGGVAWMLGHRVVVARLTLDFRNMMRIGTDASVASTLVGVDGRKVTCRATLSHGGTVFAEAEGLCIVLRE